MLTNWQQQIVIGTVLGGSSLIKSKCGKNYYLSMRCKNNLWLNYKTQELSNIFLKDSYNYRCNSICCEELSIIHDKLYHNKNRCVIKESVLYPMLDIGLAIWFLDAGGFCGRSNKNVFINTTKLNKDGTNNVIEYFKELDIVCRRTMSNNRIRIIFDINSSEKFVKIIEPRIPLFMCNNYGVIKSPDSKVCGISNTSIKSEPS